jgi:hypothetical protein
MNRRKFTIVLASSTLGSIVLPSRPSTAVDNDRFRILSPGSSRPPNSSLATPGPSIQTAMTSSQTGIFRALNVSLSRNGTVETLAILNNGQIVDLHSRRSGTFLPRRSGSTGIRVLSNSTYQSLLQSYSVNSPISNAAQLNAFRTLIGTAPTPNASPVAGCPADFAGKTPPQKKAVKNNPAYASCFLQTQLPENSPLQQMAMVITEAFSMPAASAAEYELLYFSANSSNFWSSWAMEYVPDGYFAFNIAGFKAIWSISG